MLQICSSASLLRSRVVALVTHVDLQVCAFSMALLLVTFFHSIVSVELMQCSEAFMEAGAGSNQ